jgi:hypothetical protein
MTGLEWLVIRAFLKAWWKEILAGLLVLFIAGSLWRHIRNDNNRELELAQTKELAAQWRQANAALMDSLADADNAAKVAIAAKVEAEKQAARKLAAERKKWQRIYSSKPENRAWADAPIPADVREALR